MVSKRKYCCAGARWLKRHTADCDGLTIVGEFAPFEKIDLSRCGPSCACLGGGEHDRDEPTVVVGPGACGCVGNDACGQGVC